IGADEKREGFQLNVAFLNAPKVLRSKSVNLNSTFHTHSQCLISSVRAGSTLAPEEANLAARLADHLGGFTPDPRHTKWGPFCHGMLGGNGRTRRGGRG